MKMNKIIIPAAAVAMGIALVGSVSSTLAWYQYSTKAQAAYIGTSVGESENLEIKVKDGEDWKWVTNAKNSDIQNLIASGYGTNILPITPSIEAANGNFDQNTALPSNFFNSIETGVGGKETYGTRYAGTDNYVQFNLELRYKKISYENSAEALLSKTVKLVDLTVVDTTDTAQDLYKAVRVHLATTSKTKLFARDNDDTGNLVSTETFGQLDTDGDGDDDTRLGYEWETGSLGNPLIYGVDQSVQHAYNGNKQGGISEEIGVIPADGTLTVTVTIWLEGWQKLSSDNADTSAIWDPTTYVNKQFKVGMRFQAE